MEKNSIVSPELIEELKIIVREEYGIHLSKQDTQELADFLVGYFSLLFKANKINKKIIYDNDYVKPKTA